jgi:hypothetical protein
MPNATLTVDHQISTLNHRAQSVASIASRVRSLIERDGVTLASTKHAPLVPDVLVRIAAVAIAVEYEGARQSDAVKDPSPGAQDAYKDAQRATAAALAAITTAELHRAHEALHRLERAEAAAPPSAKAS